jgi:hypothetical protein
MTLSPDDDDVEIMQEMYDMRCLHSALSLGLYTRVDSEPYLTTLGESITQERQLMSE